MRRSSHASGGYVYLLTVLAVGVIASTVTFTFLLLSTSSTKTGITVMQSAAAMAVAQACAEYALQEIFENPSYVGNEVRTYGIDECEILTVVGSGNEDRAICVDATSGQSTRRLEILIKQILPKMQIFSWQEVAVISACSY